MTQRGRKLVMIGNGMAGLACLDAILARDPSWETTVFGEEAQLGYNRILLSTLIAGECSAQDLITHDADWYAARGVTLHAGTRVREIDRARRVVRDDAGRETAYDRLLLATGSEAWVPPIEGAARAGVHVFRTLEDTEAIVAASRLARRAVVIGGGLLGLEAARGLAKRRVDVTVVHLMPWLMEQQVDAAAGALLRDGMQRLGVRVLLERKTLRFEGANAPPAHSTPLGSGDSASLRAPLAHSRVARVVLEGGEALEADLVVVAAGIRPRTELARAAGLDVKRGVVVDDFLRTSDPEIFAVGECTEHAGRLYGLVAPLYEQGVSLAAAINGDFSRPYQGSLIYSKLKVAGVNLFSVGRFTPSPAAAASEALRVEDTGAGLYRKVVIEDGRAVGAILMGQIDDGPRLVGLVAKGVAIADEAERRALLLGSLAAGAASASLEADELAALASLPDDANVCGCMGVAKGAIVRAAQAGATTLAELKRATRASTSCGSCAGTCERLIRLTTGEAAGAAVEDRYPNAEVAHGVLRQAFARIASEFTA